MFLLALFITIILWLFNLEFNSSLGHVWLRPNADGKIIFAWRSLIGLLIEPFHNSFFWLPKNWDINFYTLFGMVYILGNLLDRISK